VHFALRQCAGHFEQAIGKRGFAVIDVRDDTKIADELWVHLPYDRQGLSFRDVTYNANLRRVITQFATDCPAP
jgi:hypothetical protein